MKGKKRGLIFVLAGVMLLSSALFVACNNRDGDSGGTSTGSNSGGTSTGGNSGGTSACNHIYKITYDSASHWEECTKCGEKKASAAHDFVANGGNKKCVGCELTAEYTADENVACWREGILKENLADDDYTAISVSVCAEDGEEETRYVKEARSGNKYYRQNEVRVTDETGKTEVLSRGLAAVRTVKDGDRLRTKHYAESREKDEDGKERISKYGYYVAPDYAGTEMQYAPSEVFDFREMKDAGTFEALREAYAKNWYEGDAERKDEISFSVERNADGSVTLVFKAKYRRDRTEPGEDEEETVSYVLSGVYELKLTVADGKITQMIDYEEWKNEYADETKNEAGIEKQTIDYAYGVFDDEFYDGIDVATEETPDYYFADIRIMVEDTDDCFWYDEKNVGDMLDAQTLREYIDGNPGFIIGNYDGLNVFTIYLDEECKTPLTEIRLEEEEYTFYLKFTPPEGKAIVLTTFKEKRTDDDGNEYEIVICRTAYLEDVNERFYARSVFSGYEILAIDGEEEFEYSSFVCAESRLYVILYGDRTSSETACKPLPWEYDEESHRKYCGEHRNETLEWGFHDFVIRDGNRVCEVCGYTLPYTAEENFEDWAAARNSALNTAEDVYTYSYAAEYYDGETEEAYRREYLKESCAGNRYFILSRRGRTRGEEFVVSTDLTALKIVNNELKVVRFFRSREDEEASSNGTWKKRSFSADEMKTNPPSAWFGKYCIDVGESTPEEFFAAFKEAYEAYYAEDKVVVSDMSFRRNDDGSVSFLFRENGEYVVSSVADEGYVKNTYTAQYAISTDEYNGNIVKATVNYRDVTVYEDETKNEFFNMVVTELFSDDFDVDTYAEIPDETDETTDERVCDVKFVIEGYEFAGGTKVAMGDTLTLEDVIAYFADFDARGTWITIQEPIFSKNIGIYTDEKMSVAFDAFKVGAYNEELTLYVKLNPPVSAAWVVSVQLVGNGTEKMYIRYIQGCMTNGENFYFNAANSLSGFTVVSVDGGEPSGDGTYSFEGGTVHVIVLA